MIIPKLHSLVSQSMAEALIELSKIGKNNPIGAFVQIASSLDQDVLAETITKMEDLNESLIASLEEDHEHEITSQGQFEILVVEIADVRKHLEGALADDRQEKSEAVGSLANEERYLAEQELEKATAGKGLAAKINQCQLWKSEYDSTKISRYDPHS